MYTHKTTLRLRDTDAAGVIYFANIFDLAHEAFEAFMDSVGMDIGVILRSTPFDLPVVHAEADFKKPILPGDKLRIHVWNERVGDTSFTLMYRVFNSDDVEVAEVRITHVVVDRKEGVKKALTEELRFALKQLQAAPDRT
jgi:1,4-dihydroxy-2-naphthoyl-CoA hydrolase